MIIRAFAFSVSVFYLTATSDDLSHCGEDRTNFEYDMTNVFRLQIKRLMTIWSVLL